MSTDTPNTTDFGSTASSMTGLGPGAQKSVPCPTCGHSEMNQGLEQFLGRLGINDDMIKNLKSSMQNVDIEQYLNTAREYLKDGGDKAKNYAQENPGKVAAGVAVLAVGTGLLISALNRD